MVEIVYEPISFPYARLAEALEGSAEFRQLISKTDLVIPFYYTYDPVEKVAVAALALGRANKAVYPHG